MRFEVYDDAGGGARWRLIANNGQNIASSGEAFASASNGAPSGAGFNALGVLAYGPALPVCHPGAQRAPAG